MILSSFLKCLAGQIYDNHGFVDNVRLSNKMIGQFNKILQICFYFGRIMLNYYSGGNLGANQSPDIHQRPGQG